MTRIVLFLCLLVQCILVQSRPTVRNIKSNSEFHRLLKFHKEVTGLPVIIDYFSESCGPCRMIAPHFSRLAKQYKDKAVFAKVDVNRNRETAGAQYIRSMPTFQFYSNGKKAHQFSGADTNQLQQLTQRLSMEAERNNVKVTMASLVEFYETHAPEKAKDEAALQKVLDKAGGEVGGPGHRKLVKALKKKYGAEPKTEKRYVPGDSSKEKEKSKAPTASPATSKSSGTKNTPLKANVHLATLEELKEELQKRQEEIKEEELESVDEDEEEEEEDAHFMLYSSDGYPERTVIIGAGPAGLTSAIYAARAGLRPVVVAPPSGGQLQGKGVLVENYPAVMGATGPHVVYDMQKQAARFGAVFHDELVDRVDLSSRPFKIFTNSTTIEAHTIIVSTGADSRWLNVDGEYEYRGGGVSSCATCDGFLYKDRPVVVVGGGDAAMDDALHLARTSSEVTVIHRRDKFRASHILAQRVLNHPKIKVVWNSVVESFHGTKVTEQVDDSVEGAEDIKLEHGEDHMQPTLTHILLKNKETGEVSKIDCDAAFVAIGHDPNTKMLENQIEMDKDSYIITKPYSTKTSVDGVFAAGDVADRIYRQAVTSAGSGAMAALDAEHWLDEQGIKDEAAEAEAELIKELLEEMKNKGREEL